MHLRDRGRDFDLDQFRCFAVVADIGGPRMTGDSDFGPVVQKSPRRIRVIESVDVVARRQDTDCRYGDYQCPERHKTGERQLSRYRRHVPHHRAAGQLTNNFADRTGKNPESGFSHMPADLVHVSACAVNGLPANSTDPAGSERRDVNFFRTPESL
jgi:hypothetical protein